MKRRRENRDAGFLWRQPPKAGLVELIDDDRAVLFGLLIDAAATLRGEDREQQLLRWRRRGRRAFEAAAAAVREIPGDKS